MRRRNPPRLRTPPSTGAHIRTAVAMRPTIARVPLRRTIAHVRTVLIAGTPLITRTGLIVRTAGTIPVTRTVLAVRASLITRTGLPTRPAVSRTHLPRAIAIVMNPTRSAGRLLTAWTVLPSRTPAVVLRLPARPAGRLRGLFPPPRSIAARARRLPAAFITARLRTGFVAVLWSRISLIGGTVAALRRCRRRRSAASSPGVVAAPARLGEDRLRKQ